ncbi:SMODS domain-containing nucleotidyltransferase [Paenibacillus dendritiformis]|uniref:SMODS domain-containing nucleotidyltransferase n=1 Tax=Paenibacillus dendritiformis TaxID=130049 RepID=UPI0031F5A9EA
MEKTYKSYKRADGQVVKVDFTDGISFEIVPGFINTDGISYTYPDTNNGGSWKTTNPMAEVTEFNSKNK